MGLATLIALFTGAGLLATVPSAVPGKPVVDSVQPRKELRLAQYSRPEPRKKPRLPFEAEPLRLSLPLIGQRTGGFTPW
jgi:hypothetical protein